MLHKNGSIHVVYKIPLQYA